METTTNKKPGVNEMVYLDNGNVRINGHEYTRGAYLATTRRELERRAAEYARTMG